MGGFIRKYVKKKKKVTEEIKQEPKEAGPKEAGPTAAELEQARLTSIKRRGRKSTKLKNSLEDLTLAKKTLLG